MPKVLGKGLQGKIKSPLTPLALTKLKVDWDASLIRRVFCHQMHFKVI
jgi:hypothetical protein